MKLLRNLFVVIVIAVFCHAHVDLHPHDQLGLSINDVPAERRLHWMRVANTAMYKSNDPCPQAPFGSAIVNTTSDELICAVNNQVGTTGDPTMHGEITAIRECTRVLREKGLSVQETLAAWKHFSLYTNGEPCPMCMSAIRWAGFKEVIYGSSIDFIARNGRNQIYIPSNYILEKSYSMGHMTLMLGGILANETNIMFAHQFNESAPCPTGCRRQSRAGQRVPSCQPNQDWQKEVEKQFGKHFVVKQHDEL